MDEEGGWQNPESGREHQPRQAQPQPGLSSLGALRERLRYMHYSMRTEGAYVFWMRHYLRWAGHRHPRTIGDDGRRAGDGDVEVPRVREPASPCYRATPSSTARATSAS